MNGTHIPKSKTQLSEMERELLTNLLDFTDSGPLYLITAKRVTTMMNWDIRQTTGTLSNLVGMDLCVESNHDSHVTSESTNEFSSSEPVYGIESNSVIYKRAVYARDRNVKGTTLFHILRGDEEFGKGLWPFRPTDRVKLTGRVESGGKLVLTYKASELVDMVGKEVSVTIQS